MISPLITMNEYLSRVCTFLRRELPTKYWTFITIENDKVVIRLNPLDKAFNDIYNELLELITERIYKVRERSFNLDFSIWTPNQERTFSILK